MMLSHVHLLALLILFPCQTASRDCKIGVVDVTDRAYDFELAHCDVERRRVCCNTPGSKAGLNLNSNAGRLLETDKSTPTLTVKVKAISMASMQALTGLYTQYRLLFEYRN